MSGLEHAIGASEARLDNLEKGLEKVAAIVEKHNHSCSKDREAVAQQFAELHKKLAEREAIADTRWKHAKWALAALAGVIMTSDNSIATKAIMTILEMLGTLP